ncbi:ankyrin repeat domain-containing protein [Actinoplanes utahensis]|uniref:Uncharacterized protein n=1 Tax=Actinoplanes utahensis TaxID=1869 RepID=A0A0A6UPM3_ACTUT|nr:ankyrin repeat domain-containing protein [Actinoplanes utahensis]KHD77381.1 hypothetical protein MB27_11580 [Actinoplanes utahensis]GIF32862.1 hypothetical protein Aut01nite_58480 [Actinoplanes utahensis]
MSGADPLELSDWLRIRRHTVPDWMIEECTAARERGDWRLACAIGEVEIAFDERDAPLDDLAGFAPDLLRWHLPRHAGGHTTLLNGTTYVLTEGDPVLVLRSPVSFLGSQRLTLDLMRRADITRQRHVRLPRPLWDAREADRLRTMVGGSARRVPYFDPGGSPLPPSELGIGDDAPARAERRHVDRRDGFGPERGGLPDPSVDLDLVRHGLLQPHDLHPLVRSSLFPTAPAAVPATPPVSEPVRVRCGSGWHEVLNRSGRLDLLDHTATEHRRERALQVLGGAAHGCFAVEQAWTGPVGRLPRRLRADRDALWLRIQHGGTRAALDALAAGMDPDLRDSRGRNLMHALGWFDHRRVLPVLLAAGVEVDARDREGCTPLARAVSYPWSLDLIEGLIAAGADPYAPSADDPDVPIHRCDHIRRRMRWRGADPATLAVIEFFERYA